MKKVVLMTGVLAAGLAAAPVTANAAAPSSPNVQEVNDYTPKDADDIYESIRGQLAARFNDIANLRNRFENGLTPFTPEELKYKLQHPAEGEAAVELGWHDKAKAEVEADLSRFDHELQVISQSLENAYTTYGGDADKAEAFITTAQALLNTLISEQYAKEVLPVKYQHLNQNWRIYTEYQKLGSKKWAEYYAFTTTPEYKQVNETDDVKNDVLVEEKSNTFRLFYEGKHANRLQDVHEFCNGECCLDNLAKIEELYQEFCAEFEAEKTLVAKYHKDREALLEGETGLDAAYNNFLDNVKIDPTDIVSKNGNPGEVSGEATAQLNLKQTEIENAQAAARDFIQTFNVAETKKADWETPNWVGEGQDIIPDTKKLNNKNYNEEATRLIGVVTKRVGEYSDLVKAAELNRDNYDALVKKIKDVEDWNRAEKYHDADELDVHADVKYYESEAFDNEVPDAYLEALNAAEQAYEKFVLIPAKASDPYAEIANTKYNDYAQLVKDANANEGAHDAQHVVLDGLKKTYNALVAEYDKFVDGLLVNDTADHSNIEAAGVNELYPINADHSYAAKATEKAKHNVEAAKGLLDAAYNTANTLTETIYDLGKSVQRDAELQEKYAALNTENGNFRTALDKAIDNEVAFLEGAHLYDATLAQAHHDLDEYAHHPETFGHWNTEIQAVLDLFPPVLAALVNAYDVEADARNYVTNDLPTEVNKLKNAVAELEQLIKDNQTARDANEAAINATLTDLAALKAKYDTTKFTLEDKVTTGEATALKADFQKAWKDYVANDLKVPALFEAPATESDLHFAQTAKYADDVKVEDIDFDADIQAMLSAIKSENSIDFDIHHQATNDYALNLAAVKYIKDVVIPALNATFDALVQANEEAHKAQYEAYTALLEETYECAKIAGTAIAGISVPGDKHSLAEGVVKGDLEALKAQIDNSYIAGSAKADNDKVAKLNNKYVKDLAYAKANDETFKAAYDKYVTENGKVAKVNGKVVENWKNGYQYENTTSEGKNKYSDTANTNVTSAYTNMSAVEKKYLEDIKKYWVNNVPVWEADAVAPNAAAPYAGIALSVYTEKVTEYNIQVQRAKNNDAYFEELITELGKKITLTKQEEYVGATGTLANLFEHLNGYKVNGNEGVYDELLKEIVANWEGEDLIWNGLNSTEMQKVKAYKQNAENYNALVEKVNALVLDQKALDERKELISKLEIITTQLSTDDKTQWDEQRGDYAQQTGILGKEHELQDRIDALATAIDNEYHNGTASNWKETAEKINSDIYNDLYWPAVEENNKFLANENAFKGTATNRYQDIKDAIATYNDTSTMTPVVAEAYLKGVADKLKKLETLKNTLETKYLAEKAVNYAPEFDAELNDLLKGVGEGADHNFGLEESKQAAEAIGENLGDVNNKYKGVDEWDITNTKDNPGLVEVYLYNLCGMDNENYEDYKNGDLDFNGEIDPNDITLLNNLLWYKSVWGKEGRPKAPATDVEFEGSVDLVVAGNTVALALNNNVAVNSMSFDVKVPAGAKFSSVIGTARTEGLQVMSAQIAADTYRVLVVSLGANKVINGNEGNLVSFNVAGEGEVEVFNVRAANGLSHKLNGAAVSLGQTTGIDEVASEGNSDIFGLDGIRQSVMKAGVNIVRGANGAVKKIFK